jgi:DNA-binding transcriptional regulator YhcF (GntR family)
MKEKEVSEKFKNGIVEFLDGMEVLDVKEEFAIGSGEYDALADMVVTVKVGRQRRKLLIEFKQRGYPRDLEQGISGLRKLTEKRPQYIPVLVVPFISETGRRQARAAGVNYLDLSGNIHIAFDSVLIHKTSPRNEFSYKKKGIDIFSDKASLVLRELLARPEELHTVRGLANSASISVGWTSEVLREIEERGYLERTTRKGCRIRRIEHLLDDWTVKYNFFDNNRARHFFLRSEGIDETLSKLRESSVPEDVSCALTLHGGAHLVSPFVQFNECHAYVGGEVDFDNQVERIAEDLRLSEQVSGGNFHIVKPYYVRGAFYQARILDGLMVVSDLQLYLDLHGFPVRGKEQAERILERSGLPGSTSW